LGVELCIDLSLADSRRSSPRPRSAAGVLLAGCNSDEISLANNAKANQPVPPKLVADMAAKDIGPAIADAGPAVQAGSRTRSLEAGSLRPLRTAETYPICRWSGDLGPKVREGDRQAPEGFYSISPGQMNPQSAYYLSFNTGYPNAFDKALGRSGSQLMVHWRLFVARLLRHDGRADRGNLSLGARILLRRPARVPTAGLSVQDDAAEHGQTSQQPEHAVLENDQGGYDHFEVTRQEPKVDFWREEICIRRRQAAGQPPRIWYSTPRPNAPLM